MQISPFLKSSFKSIILCAILCTTASAKEIDTLLADQLQTTLEVQQAKYKLVGAAAAVIIPGKGTWKGETGSSAQGQKLSSNMLFGVGSVTKTYTAAVIHQLAEEGKLLLNDSLFTFLPAFENIDTTIQIRQLLNHTSGIFNYTNHPDWAPSVNSDLYKIWQPEEIAATFVNKPDFKKGAGWKYSNTNYLLLGMIIQNVTGNKVSAEIRERLLKPNQLFNTYFDIEEKVPQAQIAHNWTDITGDGVRDDATHIPREALNSMAWAAGTIMATPEDIALWAQHLFKGNVLKPESLTEMLKFRSLSLGATTGWGLGVSRQSANGKIYYGHGGKTFGYAADMEYSPSDSVSVGVVINQDADAEPVALELLKTVKASLATSVAEDEVLKNGSLSCTPQVSSGIMRINYVLEKPANVQLSFYNAQGREVMPLLKSWQDAGSHEEFSNVANLPQGVYFMRLIADGKAQTFPISVVK
ncbi:MAG: serine hydrolase [Bacteroidota bacterium]